jgi:hypothetical protein
VGPGTRLEYAALSALAPDSRLEEQGNNERVSGLLSGELGMPFRCAELLIIRCTGLLRDAA